MFLHTRQNHVAEGRGGGGNELGRGLVARVGLVWFGRGGGGVATGLP
jgi:hypothetical protein